MVKPDTAQNLRSTFYLQLEPLWSRRSGQDGERMPLGFKPVGVTQNRPQSPRAGSVTVKLTVAIPPAAFLPLRPEAEIVIPASLMEINPVVVEATAPEGEDQQ